MTLAEAKQDDYRKLAERREPNPPRDMSAEWERFTPITKAPDGVVSPVERWAHSKGFGVPAMEKQGARYRVNVHGGITLAYPVRTAAGTIVGIKLRSLDGRKSCVPGSSLTYPAMPTLYGCQNPRRVFVCEGESDAAFLLDHAQDTDAVLCCHAGAAVFRREWTAAVPKSAVEVFIATDSDRAGESFAQRWLGGVPGSRRLKPPAPCKDWCEVAEARNG